MVRKIIEAFVKYPILGNLIIVVTLIAGGVSLYNMKKSSFPETSARSISIQVVYPGASPEEMEEGVTLKVEEAVHNIVGVDEINSTSSENVASINVSTLKNQDIDDIYTEIKNAVDRISSFPLGAERPTITKNKNRSTAQWLGLSGDVDLFTLKKIGEEIEDELIASGVITQVTVMGFPELEITIEVGENDLARYNLTFDAVAGIVRANNRDISAGAIKASNEEYLIRSRAKVSDADKIGEIVLRSNEDGSKLFLRDVAKIEQKFAENPNRWTMNGKEAVFLRVDKLPEEDLKEISLFVSDYIEEFNDRQSSVQLQTNFDFYDLLGQRLAMLYENGTVGLTLVLISLSLFLSMRLSFWVAFGIPLSFMGMFIIAGIHGMTINMISLFGMILVVGILVDDGIVIAENIYTHFEKGKSPHQAAVDGAMEVIPAVTVSVTTTIIAFAPLLLLDGPMEFLYDMAFVIIASLGFSLIEAFLVLPSHLGSAYVLRARKKVDGTKSIRDWLEQGVNFMRHKIYGRALTWTMKYKFVSVAFLIGMFFVVSGLMQGGFIKSTFFPPIAFSGFTVDVSFKAGTPEAITDKFLRKTERDIWDLNEELKAQYNDTTDFITTTFAGLGSTSGSGENGGHVGTVQVFHRELDGDPMNGFELIEEVRKKIGEVPEAEKLTIGNFNRFGKPVAIRLMGKDTEALDGAKDFLKAELALLPELKEVKDDIAVGKRELNIDMTKQAYFLGLSDSEVTKQIRQGFFGEEVQRLQKGTDEVKVWVRYPKSDRLSIGQLEDMKVKVNNKEYPISELINYEIVRGVAGIKHYQTERTITVDAEMVDPFGEVPPVMEVVNTDIVPRMQAQFPGVKVDMGGQSQASAETGAEIGLYFGVAFFLIFIIIILAFKSFYQAVLIMIMIPLGWLAAVLGHGIQGVPVSLLSAWGLIALSGVIINDAVVFLDKYNRNIKEGMSVYDAAYDAGLSRFRAIILTSITTVLGLFPLILETSFQAKFLIPMAVSIAYGVMFGTAIILLFFPVWILVFNDVRRYAKYLWEGKKPSPESVERVIIDEKKSNLLNS